MAPSCKLKVIDQCRILPSPSSSSSSRPSLPLTFFDLVFLPFPPVQRLFFYDYKNPVSHFLDVDLPILKHSLSMALHHFYPLAGNLIKSHNNPIVHCSGNDSIRFIVAVSTADFHQLSGNHARDINLFHPLVLPLLDSEDDKSEEVLAVQVSLFPNCGIGIGTTLHHAVADGSTYTRFMKTWAAYSNSSFKNSSVSSFPSLIPPLPCYDRSLVHDHGGWKNKFLKDLEFLSQDPSLQAWDMSDHDNIVRATFVFTKSQLNKLATKTSTQCSSYALACGYIWACLTKARPEIANKNSEHFGFVTGCRARHDPPLRDTYFGNCLGICCLTVKRKDLIAKNGAVVAAEAIWGAIKGLEDGVFARAENWIKDVFGYAAKKALTVAGSPKLRIYEMDFGWGRPRKVEVVSIERTGALALAETRDEEGGIEVGLVLPNCVMKEFIHIFTQDDTIQRS